jgi:hypothetical protein
MGWGCQPGFRSPDLHLYDQEKPLIFANGGTMLVHRQTFLDLGGFDEDYFAYYEDVDLGWRLWLAGHTITYAPKALVYHRHHGSWDTVSSAKKWLLAERNTLLTLIKNYDDDSLAHILPAALLLLLQRVYLDINLDPALFGGSGGAPQTAVYNTRYYLNQLKQLVLQANFRTLYHRARAELRRRLAPQSPNLPISQSPKRAFTTPVNGHFTVDPAPLARLAAAQDILDLLPKMLEKREKIQNGRKRPDDDLFPLFQWALISNFGDDAFIHAMNRVVNRFQIDKVVAGTAPSTTPETRQKSWELSQALLALMRDLFNQSHADRYWFQMNGTATPEAVTVPHAQVKQLAELHKQLWTLPATPLDPLLDSLVEKLT